MRLSCGDTFASFTAALITLRNDHVHDVDTRGKTCIKPWCSNYPYRHHLMLYLQPATHEAHRASLTLRMSIREATCLKQPIPTAIKTQSIAGSAADDQVTAWRLRLQLSAAGVSLASLVQKKIPQPGDHGLTSPVHGLGAGEDTVTSCWARRGSLRLWTRRRMSCCQILRCCTCHVAQPCPHRQ